jgi:hypothetical protein
MGKSRNSDERDWLGEKRVVLLISFVSFVFCMRRYIVIVV